ncbi:hypothetical protein MRAB57_1578, partial [Mycobacterium rhizamassiliense]
LLPSRVLPASGEALDGYLERLAGANALRTSQLLKILRGANECPRKSPLFLLIEPGHSFVTRVAEISGATTAMLDATTLNRFGGGLPLWLDGFDPLDRHSFRQIVAQGWFPNTGSQICPQCLAHDHVWQLSWRLPVVTTCLIHKTLLTESCRGCGNRFRLRRYSPLRPVIGPDEPCSNQIGLRAYCRHSALAHVASPAPPDVVTTASAISGAMSSRPNTIFCESTSPQTYLAELRHLATLLLHLATTPRGACLSDWTEHLAAEAATRRTELRGPRWGFSPPFSALARGKALGAAGQIFEQATVERGAELLAPWLELIAHTPGGPSNWIDNRTSRSPIMRRLVAATLANRRGAGRRVDYSTRSNSIPLEAIPHMIDVEVYRNFFKGTLGSYEWTARLYVSLCLARVVRPGSTWALAASGIGLPSILGIRTARAASQRMRIAPDDLARRVSAALTVLPPDRDYRHRERRVTWLADHTDVWFERWRMSVSPPRRATSLPYAITWLWWEVAQGWPASGPVSTTMVGQRRRDSYQSFRARLPRDAEESLRSLVLLS